MYIRLSMILYFLAVVAIFASAYLTLFSFTQITVALPYGCIGALTVIILVTMASISDKLDRQQRQIQQLQQALKAHTAKTSH